MECAWKSINTLHFFMEPRREPKEGYAHFYQQRYYDHVEHILWGQLGGKEKD